MKGYSVKRGIFTGLFLSAILAVLTVSIFWALNEINESEIERKQLREKSLESQKTRLKKHVNRILHYIKHQHSTNSEKSKHEIQEEILAFIATIRFGSGGYAFVNTLDGQALVFEGEKQSNYLTILDISDIHGKKLFPPQIEAFHNGEEGGFMQYYFRRIGGNKAEPKLSYMKGYHEWNWIIGAGEYLEDIDKEIVMMEEALKQRLKSRIIYIIILLLLLMVILLFISIYLSKYIDREFNIFNQFFKDSKSGDRIDTNMLSINELKLIADHANHMINEIDHTTVLLKESEEKFRTLIESSADAILIADQKGNYIYTNHKARELLGYSSTEILKMNISDLAAEHEKETHKKEFQELIVNGQCLGEIELKRKDGTIIPVDLNAVVLPNGSVFGSFRDISQRRKADAALKGYQENLEKLVKNRTQELEEKNKELERFNKLFIGREFRIKELKEKLKRYEKENEE